MRFVPVLFAALCFGQSASGPASITGRVVSAVTGAPLKKATVSIELFSPDTARDLRVSPASTVSDEDGLFTLSNLAPGEYHLNVSRVGYLDQGYGAASPQVIGPPVSLNPGETLRDLTVKLTPQSLLYGKVVDEDGDPVPGAEVEVLRVSFAGGRRHLAAAANGQAQDDGSFVIGNLNPGRYFLKAAVRHIDAQPGHERPIPTYFPSVLKESSAAPIVATAGAEVRDLAIRLRSARVYSIRGRTVPPVQTNLRIDNRAVTTGADGSFEFEGLPAGSYRIGTTTVVVEDRDVEDVSIPVGRVTVSGLVKGASSGAVFVGADLAEIRADGSFDFPSLAPEVQPLRIEGLPEGSYVTMINFAGKPVDDWKLDLTSGAGGELLVAVSPNAAEVSGVVPNGGGALVQLWPAGGDTAKSVKAGARGEFTFRSIPPGDYRIAAFQNLDDDLAQYPPFRAAFEAQAAKVKVSEKSRQRVEVKLIGRDAIAAEAAKLQ